MFETTSRIGVCGLAASAALIGAQQAQASALPAEFGNAIPGFFGTEVFSATFSGFTVNAEVNYAVFAPNAPQGFLPITNEYIYAYEIINLGPDVSKLTVGLDGDEPLGGIGSYSSGGSFIPTTSAFVGAGPTSAAWDFTAPNALPSQGTSAILRFNSAAAPEWDTATVSSAWFDTKLLPSPTPEPASLGLMAMGLAAIGFRRKA